MTFHSNQYWIIISFIAKTRPVMTLFFFIYKLLKQNCIMIDIKEILGEKDFNDFLDYNPENLHVIKFGATWCGPCKSLESRMKNIDSDKIGNTLFAEIDISENDECEAIAEKFGVSGIPCMIYLKDKEVADRTVGLVTLDDIYNRINKLSE